MIAVTTEYPNQAWLACFVALAKEGCPVEFNGFYRNETAAIEILDINKGLYSSDFPMSDKEISNISKYLLTGHGEIEHDWSKVYRQRLFDDENHIKKIIETLRSWPDCPRAQVTAWKNTDLDRNTIAPCLQMLWFKIINDQLCLHVHMRTSDCYGKLLMNFNEFIGIQKYVAGELGLKTGSYTHFVDSLHFHSKDTEEVNKLFRKIEGKSLINHG